MILGCLIPILVLVYVLCIFIFVGSAITIGLLAKFLVPVVIIILGVYVLVKNKKD